MNSPAITSLPNLLVLEQTYCLSLFEGVEDVRDRARR